MMNYKEEAYLMHYGMLGMKWGRRKIRRAENGSALSAAISRATSKSNSKIAGAISKAAGKHSVAMQKKADRIKSELDASKKPKAKDLSDDELRKRINRLQMEKQYKELSAGTITKGKNTALKIVGGAAKTAVSAILVVEATKVIKSAMGKK